MARLTLPEPWIGNVTAALALIDDLDDQIDGCERELRRLGADHPYVPLLVTAPGIAWVLGYTIAAISDLHRGRGCSPSASLVSLAGGAAAEGDHGPVDLPW